MELAASARHPGDRGLRPGVRRQLRRPARRHASARSAASACSRASTSRPAKAASSSTNDDALARRMFLFINKAWGYGDPKPDHYFLALNYRMSELQGAVALAQLPKLDGVVERRVGAGRAPHRAARRRCRASRRPCVATGERRTPTGSTACWSTATSSPAARRRSAPRSEGARASPRRRATSRSRRSSARSSRSSAPSATAAGRSRWRGPRPSTTTARTSPARSTALERVLVLPWNERYTDEHVDYIADVDSRRRSARLSRGAA